MPKYKLVGTSKAFTHAPVTLAQEVVVLEQFRLSVVRRLHQVDVGYPHLKQR